MQQSDRISRCREINTCRTRAGLVLAATTVALGLASSRVRGDVVISDDTFLDANWSHTVIANENDAWTNTVGQVPTGGNPGSYRGHAWSIGPQENSTEYTLTTFDAFSGQTYNPSVAGALANLTYDYDAFVKKPDNSAGVIFVNPALQQGDSIYAANFAFLADQTTWKHETSVLLTPTSFTKLSGTGPANPDFGATGGAITFGYNDWLRAQDYSVTHGVDNFHVTLTPAFTGGATTGHFAVNVDFGDRAAFNNQQGALPTAGNTWNDLNGGNPTASSLRDSQNNQTSVGYRWAPYTNFDNLQPVNAVGDYVDGAWPALTSDGALNGIDGDPTPDKFGGQLYLTGLVANSKHTVLLYGTLYGESGDHVDTTTFTVNGKARATTSLVDGEGLNYVTFQNVVADANGEIFIQMRNHSQNVDGRGDGGYWAINGFQLESLGITNSMYNASSSGTFSTASNWTAGVPSGAGSVAELRGSDGANVTVTLSAPQTLGTIGFAGTRSYKIAGSNLTLDGGDGYRGVVNVGGGSHEIASSLAFGPSGGELIIAPNAKLTLSGAVSGTIGRLSVGTGGTLDISTTTPLIVDYFAQYSNVADLDALLTTGRAAGGTGITSSLVAANSKYALVALESSSVVGASGGTYRGQNVDGSAAILGVFLRGDTNVDGTVNFSDLLNLAKNYSKTTDVGWQQGDSDFSSTVDFADLLNLAKNYNQSLSAAQSLLAASGVSSSFQADWTLAQSLVPEPTAIMAIASLTLVGGSRRRRV